MTRQAGLVIENDSNYYLYGTAQTCLLPNLRSNEITAGVTDGMHVVTPVAQGIVKGDSTDDLTLTTLLSTSLSLIHIYNARTGFRGNAKAAQQKFQLGGVFIPGAARAGDHARSEQHLHAIQPVSYTHLSTTPRCWANMLPVS